MFDTLPLDDCLYSSEKKKKLARFFTQEMRDYNLLFSNHEQDEGPTNDSALSDCYTKFKRSLIIGLDWKSLRDFQLSGYFHFHHLFHVPQLHYFSSCESSLSTSVRYQNESSVVGIV